MKGNLRAIEYDVSETPNPTFAGGILWVLLFFFPVPLMVLLNWWLNRQPDLVTLLLRFLTGMDWRMGLAGALTFSGCVGLVAFLLRYFQDPQLVAFLQSVTDKAGLEGLSLRITFLTPAFILPLTFLRKMGMTEFALLAGVEATLLAARSFTRFPRREIELVPADQMIELEPLLKLEGEVVTYTWEFQPTQFELRQTFTLQLAFNLERLEQASERPRQRQSDGDWLRFAHTDCQTPELLALANKLHHEIFEKQFWSPFQRFLNLLALMSTFDYDDSKPRYALETLHEKAGSENDLVIAVANLLPIFKDTVPEAVLVLSQDRNRIGLGIVGAEHFPEAWQGFTHEGRRYFFVVPERRDNQWHWHIGNLFEHWQPITIFPVVHSPSTAQGGGRDK